MKPTASQPSWCGAQKRRRHGRGLFTYQGAEEGRELQDDGEYGTSVSEQPPNNETEEEDRTGNCNHNDPEQTCHTIIGIVCNWV